MTHLIPISVTANDNGFHPSRHQPGNVLADNSFPEDSATEDVSNCPIGRLPHLLQLELFHSLLIRSDGCTLYANVVFLYGFSSFHGHFIICSITMLNAQVIAVTNTKMVRTAQDFCSCPPGKKPDPIWTCECSSSTLS